MALTAGYYVIRVIKCLRRPRFVSLMGMGMIYSRSQTMVLAAGDDCLKNGSGLLYKPFLGDAVSAATNLMDI